MRALIWIAMLAMLIMVAGCGINTGSTGSATVSGTVVDQATGQVPAGNTFVSLVQNGTTIIAGTAPLTNGVYSILNVPNGSGYTLVVVSSTGNFTQTILGPFTVNGVDLSMTVPVLSTAELQQKYPAIGTPSLTSSTVVAFAQDANGSAINVTMTVDSGTPSVAANPAVQTGIAPGTHQVTLTNPANAQTVTISGIALTGGDITILRSTIGTTQTTVTLAGTLSQQGSSPLAPFGSVPLILRQNGTTQVGTTTTNSYGSFTFSNVPAGMNYTIEANSPTQSFVRTIFGPSSFTADNTTLNLQAFTADQLLQQFGVSAPSLTTATLVVFGQSSTGVLIPLNALTSTVPPQNATGTPAVLTNLTPATYAVTVTNTQTAQSVLVPNITLAAGTITVLNVAGSQLGFTSGSLTAAHKQHKR